MFERGTDTGTARASLAVRLVQFAHRTGPRRGRFVVDIAKLAQGALGEHAEFAHLFAGRRSAQATVGAQQQDPVGADQGAELVDLHGGRVGQAGAAAQS